MQGRIQGGGGAHPARAPLKVGKNMGAIFLSAPPPDLKSWIRPCNGQINTINWSKLYGVQRYHEHNIKHRYRRLAKSQ